MQTRAYKLPTKLFSFYATKKWKFSNDTNTKMSFDKSQQNESKNIGRVIREKSCDGETDALIWIIEVNGCDNQITYQFVTNFHLNTH